MQNLHRPSLWDSDKPTMGMIDSTIHKIAARFVSSGVIEGDYPLEMTLQALCEIHAQRPDFKCVDLVSDVWRQRQWEWSHPVPHKKQPFAAHNGALARIHPNADAAETVKQVFIDQTGKMLAEEPRDQKGRVTHWSPRLPQDGRQPLLIDFMSGYASRLAEAASLGGPPEWYDQAVYQFIEYAHVLPHPQSELWHLGRGWREDPDELCHGAWSRGHGWLIRGLAETLRWLPEKHHKRSQLIEILESVASALEPIQLPEGRWPVLLHREPDESAAETSGSALIGYGLARAIHDGHLRSDRWRKMAERTIRSCCNQVDAAGIVHGACKGPGTLFTEGVSLYLGKSIEPNDHHGAPCVLYGALGGLLLDLD